MSFGPEYIHGLQAALKTRLPWRISKVEGGDTWIALRVSSPPQEWFLISWGTGSAGCCLVEESAVTALKKAAPARTPLVEALKSRFLKGQIVAVRQLNADRLLEFDTVRFVAAGFSVRYFLILEATEPTGNLVLLDEGRRIEEVARHASPDRNRYRTILPGHLYSPPPDFEGPSPLELDRLEFEDLMQLKGVGRPLARLIAAHWEERDPSAWLNALRELHTDVPLYCQRTSKGYLTRFPLLFKETENLGENILAAAGRGVLAPLLSALRSRLMHDLDARIARVVKSRERHMDGLQKQLKNNENAEVFRRKGELLLAHITEIPPRADRVVLSGWDGSEPLDIALDPNLLPSHNAERYFRKYRKAKTDPQKVREEMDSLQKGIEELKEQRELLDTIDEPSKFEEAVKDVVEWILPQAVKPDRKKSKTAKENALPPHLRFEVSGYTIWVGLSARGNRFVTFKQAVGDDLWLHVHEMPGAHVVIKGARGRSELEGSDVLAFAASLAAAHSRAKATSSVQVDYTERRYVRAVPGAAIALVTYTNPGTIRVGPTYWREFLESVRNEDVHEAPAEEAE